MWRAPQRCGPQKGSQPFGGNRNPCARRPETQKSAAVGQRIELGWGQVLAPPRNPAERRDLRPPGCGGEPAPDRFRRWLGASRGVTGADGRAAAGTGRQPVRQPRCAGQRGRAEPRGRRGVRRWAAQNRLGQSRTRPGRRAQMGPPLDRRSPHRPGCDGRGPGYCGAGVLGRSHHWLRDALARPRAARKWPPTLPPSTSRRG